MRLGLCLPQLGTGIDSRVVREFAMQADAMGFDSLWAQEHLFYPLTPRDQQSSSANGLWPEQYKQLLAPMELLAFVGAITKRIRVGTSILVTAYHSPLMLAKQAATIDVLTNGRLLLGLGLGWSRDEYNLVDAPWERRGERSTDFLRALRACWSPNPVQYDGEFFKIPRSETSPKPVQNDSNGRPHIPIIGGFWSESGLRRVAELCDYWQPAGHRLEEAMNFSKKVNNMAAAAGRDPIPIMIRVQASPLLPGLRKVSKAHIEPAWSGSAQDMMPPLLEAKTSGVQELLIDTNMFVENPGAEGWIAQPSFFKPLLEAAHA